MRLTGKRNTKWTWGTYRGCRGLRVHAQCLLGRTRWPMGASNQGLGLRSYMGICRVYGLGMILNILHDPKHLMAFELWYFGLLRSSSFFAKAVF